MSDGINPLANILRFGFTPRGSGSGIPTGSDFRHEVHFLCGLPNHMVRFGRQPVGTAGGGPVTTKVRNHPFFATPGQLMHR